MPGEPLTCPRCGGLVQRREDQYGIWWSCWMGCWDEDVNAAEPIKLRKGNVGYNQGPHLPVTPSNYLPYKERERKAWERDEDNAKAG